MVKEEMDTTHFFTLKSYFSLFMSLSYLDFFYPSVSSVLIVFHSDIFIPVEGHFNLDCHTSKVCN